MGISLKALILISENVMMNVLQMIFRKKDMQAEQEETILFENKRPFG